MDDRDYIGWKNWGEGQFGVVRPGSAFYFGQILRRFRASRARVLEIGFGEGEFLEFLRARGHDVIGVESNKTLVDWARRGGFTVHLGNAWEVPELGPSRFDLIAAFSVAEHLDQGQLGRLFAWASEHLAPGGVMLLVFPEGASPLALANQNGDFTHVTSLTRAKLEALCRIGNLRVVSYSDAPLYSNALCSAGLPGKALLLILQAYAAVVRASLRVLLYPLSTSLRLGVNSVAVVAPGTLSQGDEDRH